MMVANMYLSLILLSSWALVSASRKKTTEKSSSLYFTVFFSVSALDCSSFSSDKDVIRSFSFRVNINPSTSGLPVYNYAIVNGQGVVVDLTLTTLQTIPLSIFCLRGLQSLTLQYSTNLIIPPEIIRLAYSLISLNLIGISQALTLPTELFNMTSLRNLAIISSGLETLPEAIGQLSRLSNLTLTGNRLRSLPTSLGKMMSLRWLKVDGNDLLSSLDVLTGYEGLIELSASNCAIDHLPLNMSTLKMINLSKNKLTSLDGLDSIAWFTSTSFLFSNNSITTIPTTIQRLQSLDNLDLSNNLLIELPMWLYNIKLNTIDVRNNKFDDKETEWIRGLFRPTNTSINV
jgi:Leucine-rich repeat (LRR) protein